jgi:hypothetical protein
MIYYHYHLQCPNSHRIPVPHPIPLETDGSPRKTTTENRRAVFVCPYCGLVSAYSAQDLLQDQEIGKQSPFSVGVCGLFSLEIECDGKNCGALKVVHTIHNAGKEMWKEEIAPTNWTFSDSARCGAGHPLRFDDSRILPREGPADLPF